MTSAVGGTDRDTYTIGDGYDPHTQNDAGVYVPTATPLTVTVRRLGEHSTPGAKVSVAAVTPTFAGVVSVHMKLRRRNYDVTPSVRVRVGEAQRHVRVGVAGPVG